MKKTKKLLALLIVLTFSACFFAGCASDKKSDETYSEEKEEVKNEEKEEAVVEEETTVEKNKVSEEEPEQESEPDAEVTENPVDKLAEIIKRKVSLWTMNENLDCVYNCEYDESVSLVMIDAILMNADEENPSQKAKEVESFIIEDIGLSDIQSSVEDFHLAITVIDRNGNIVLSSLDGKEV